MVSWSWGILWDVMVIVVGVGRDQRVGMAFSVKPVQGIFEYVQMCVHRARVFSVQLVGCCTSTYLSVTSMGLASPCCKRCLPV